MCLLLFCLLILFYVIGSLKNPRQTSKSPIPITIKDEGIIELNKDDVAMIFYITVTNSGTDAVHLFVRSTRCCQTIGKEKDCESITLRGGDMGKLYPRDVRNLTLLYVNLYLQDREGNCDIEIRDVKGAAISRNVPFNTMLQYNGERVPPVLKNYYHPSEVTRCDEVDQNPLNRCTPYECEIRYDGYRNYFNHTSQKCMPVPRCTQNKDGSEQAYIVQTNTCKKLKSVMTDKDFEEFRAGKPSVHGLTHVHNYPINVQCHNGHRDPSARWCSCDRGWASAPFDHHSFNPDLQVYHMCTVWTGEMSAEEARNITTRPPDHHLVTNIIVFTLLGVTFTALCVLLIFVLWRQASQRKWSARERKIQEELERRRLTDNTE